MRPTRTRNREIWMADQASRSRQAGSALSKSLREKYKRRSIRVAVGDSVSIVRGEYVGVDGRVSAVSVADGTVALEGLKKEKTKGDKYDVYVHASNLLVTSINTDDWWRRARLEGKDPKDESMRAPPADEAPDAEEEPDVDEEPGTDEEPDADEGPDAVEDGPADIQADVPDAEPGTAPGPDTEPDLRPGAEPPAKPDTAPGLDAKPAEGPSKPDAKRQRAAGRAEKPGAGGGRRGKAPPAGQKDKKRQADDEEFEYDEEDID
ncbi:50S ribosomal protein L24 (modular protein) [Nitrosopumilaceae archaeon]|nr:50S ribosomal protein L24 [Nitrosopumilus sp.]CAI9832812.1 50S ribosomal protein L24 (modular protein) [Nitrosopumilaceae archaeon]MDA7944370.1 50S ribosomal protein L24 [Nitrosopumilus sp.]MDA7954122.1 50S ribosomal protein L24 [Nitrosopumilus sp.]MDA7973050.1 50S ribosomal protein L24 [Nitrosopumilus sp.]